MSNADDQFSLAAAVEFGFLSEPQRAEIRKQADESSLSEFEIAVRKGFLNRRSLEILQAVRKPLDVAPGYRIDGLIGEGGAGVVYMATQMGLDRPVALKTISRPMAGKNDLTSKRFQREAKIIGQLRHPNIVAAVDFGIHKDRLYLVMEYIKGADAEKYLETQDKMPEAHAWHVARQVCYALASANEQGVIHRDIKPANLLLTTAPKGASVPAHVPFAKVADFGLARFKEPEAENRVTIEAAMSGTPYYMSPEQITALELDHRTDIYSLGATIWHLITGRPAVSGETPMDIISDRIKLKDDWAENVSGEVSVQGLALLKEMCRFQREDRIDNYTELTSRIESVLDTLQAASQDTAESLNSGKTVELVNNLSSRSSITYFKSLDGFEQGVRSKSEEGVKIDSLKKQDSHFSKTWLALVAGAIGVLVLTALASSFFWSSTDSPVGKNSDNFEQDRLTELVGPPLYLFDGISMNPRQKSTGTWDVGEGPEKEAVLAGMGTREFKCIDARSQPLVYFRFESGFRHHQADQIEFRLLESSAEPSAKPSADNVKFQVAVSKDSAALLVADQQQDALEIQNFGEDSFGYHNIQIESHPRHWRVLIDSKLLGVVADDPAGTSSTEQPLMIQVVVEGAGDAHFESIRFRKFDETKN